MIGLRPGTSARTQSLLLELRLVDREPERRLRPRTRRTAPALHLGTAYQIADDLHDVTDRLARSGKARGQDLASGVTGLPVLLALRDAAPRRSRRLAALLRRRPAVGTREHRRALRAVRGSPGIPAARRDLRERLDAARTACGLLPDVPAVAALTALCDLVADRRPAA